MNQDLIDSESDALLELYDWSPILQKHETKASSE